MFHIIHIWVHLPFWYFPLYLLHFLKPFCWANYKSVGSIAERYPALESKYKEIVDGKQESGILNSLIGAARKFELDNLGRVLGPWWILNKLEEKRHFIILKCPKTHSGLSVRHFVYILFYSSSFYNVFSLINTYFKWEQKNLLESVLFLKVKLWIKHQQISRKPTFRIYSWHLNIRLYK